MMLQSESLLPGVRDLRSLVDTAGLGEGMFAFVVELYPFCRSITGEGVRQTLHGVRKHIPVEIREIASGTSVFDWTIPKEWNIQDAYIKNSRGQRIVDFQRSNLHVVSYSIPIRTKMSLAELRPHLFTLPDRPELIPYRTSYYQEAWGFCLSHEQLLALEDDEYEVFIDSSLEQGSLTYGELLLPGKRTEEVLISTHICHPSLCNDNLSGIAVSTFLAKALSGADLNYSYRFLFIPGTIGSIAWLALNEDHLHLIRHGLVATGLGDPGSLTYKKSRRGDAEIDRVVSNVLRHSGTPYQVVDFSPYGYDERQYCSPGFNLPVGVISRTPHGRFPEYHTSADNLEFVRPEYLGDSLSKVLAIVEVLENNTSYHNQNPKGEPQLGRRGLYGAIGGEARPRQLELAMLWVLNFSDGHHSLLEISDRSGMSFDLIRRAADLLSTHRLLTEFPQH